MLVVSSKLKNQLYILVNQQYISTIYLNSNTFNKVRYCFMKMFSPRALLGVVVQYLQKLYETTIFFFFLKNQL